jgi:hypothetical protein
MADGKGTGEWWGSANIKDGQLDFEPLRSVIENFQSDGIDYLYDLEPQSNNLFWAGHFLETPGNGGNGKPVRQFYNAQYRIRKISIPFPKLNIEMHKELRTPILQSAEYDQDITIEWIEDVYHSVQQYHADWISRWYSRQFDVLRCGTSGKFKQLIVIAFHYINDEAGPMIIEAPKIQPIMAFHLAGLVPKTIPDLNFDYGADGNDQNLAIQYKCGVIHWLYGDQIGLGYTQANEDINASSFSYDKGGRVWWPTGYVEMGDGLESEAAERYRVSRSATSSITV